MSTLTFLRYSNYFDRRIRREDSVEAYLNKGIEVYTFAANFDVKDGISTDLYVNLPATFDEDSFTPNYMISYEPMGAVNANLRRWHVMESTRTRSRQYHVRLLRDAVADYKRDIIASPCFVEKATLPASSPFIFNSEAMTFNQLKISETLLKDETKMAWICGYMSPKHEFGRIKSDFYWEPNMVTEIFEGSHLYVDDMTYGAGTKFVANFNIAADRLNEWFTFKAITDEFKFEDPTLRITQSTGEMPLTDSTYRDVSGECRPLLNDAPYSMFCVPYGIAPRLKNGASEVQSAPRESALSMLAELAATGLLYDLQLLPYCPERDCFVESNDETLVDLAKARGYSRIERQGRISTYLIWCRHSNVKFVMRRHVEAPTDATTLKVKALTEFERYVAPNYTSVFEFNPYKNRGLDTLDVSFTYKPFVPFIQVRPRLNDNGLYGKAFDDSFGLICGGSYSLAMTTSQWEEFQRQNINYQLAFDRSIQSLDLQNNMAGINSHFGAIAGAASGAASGALLGSMIPGIGTVAGALAGGALSLVAGTADIASGYIERADARDNTIDQFGYQLGNVRARPFTLNRISAFDAANKIWPFIETYTCTDEEKEALAAKLNYSGMTVMTIGRLGLYLNRDSLSYVKGQIIELPSIADDAHLHQFIREEVYKGLWL